MDKRVAQLTASEAARDTLESTLEAQSEEAQADGAIGSTSHDAAEDDKGEAEPMVVGEEEASEKHEPRVHLGEALEEELPVARALRVRDQVRDLCGSAFAREARRAHGEHAALVGRARKDRAACRDQATSHKSRQPVGCR